MIRPLRDASTGEREYIDLLRYCFIYMEAIVRIVTTGGGKSQKR